MGGSSVRYMQKSWNFIFSDFSSFLTDLQPFPSQNWKKKFSWILIPYIFSIKMLIFFERKFPMKRRPSEAGVYKNSFPFFFSDRIGPPSSGGITIPKIDLILGVGAFVMLFSTSILFKFIHTKPMPALMPPLGALKAPVNAAMHASMPPMLAPMPASQAQMLASIMRCRPSWLCTKTCNASLSKRHQISTKRIQYFSFLSTNKLLKSN